MSLIHARAQHRPVFRGRTARPAIAPPRASVPFDEWRAVRRLRPNVLIEGRESDVEDTLVALTADFNGRVRNWNAPEPGEGSSAVVVRDVHRLNADEQLELLQAIDRTAGRTQVIATSTQSLFELMQQRVFRSDLYYRLNTVRLVVGPSRAASS